MSSTYTLLLARPLAQLRAAAASLGLRPVFSSAAEEKAALALELNHAIQAGRITLDAIMRTAWSPAGSPAASPRPDPALAAVASRTEAETLRLASEVDSLTRGLDSVRAEVTRAQDAVLGAVNASLQTGADAQAAIAALRADLTSGLDRLAQVRVDPAAVAQEVSAAVAAAFGPFAARVHAAGAQAAVGSMVSARCIARVSVEQAFGVRLLDPRGAEVMVDIYDHPDAPPVDPAYVWTPEALRRLILGVSLNVWLGGPKGTGKTEAAIQFAARTGRAFQRINFAKYSTPEDYLGAVGLDGSSGSTSTAFRPGPFLLAYSGPATVILLDEITNTDPGNLAPLNALLEPGAVCPIGGTRWTKGLGTMIVAADNTLGCGDQSGRYAGTRGMNASLLDRFGIVAQCDYLPRDLEVRAVASRGQCSETLAGHIVDAIRVARSKVDSGDIIDPPSIRSAIAFVHAARLMPVAEAWAATVASRQPAESSVGLLAVYTACINEKTITDNL